MNIAVCVKQVPDTENIRLDPETNTLSREGVRSVVNPYDLNALELALQLKEQHGGVVTVLTMGPPAAEAALLKAVSCGVDTVYLLSDRAFAGSDTLATAYILSRALKKLGAFDLILCGKQAIDGDTAQVGPGIAVQLDIPFATSICRLKSSNSFQCEVERKMDDGTDLLLVPFPALLSIDREVGELRVPTLLGKLRAHQVDIQVLNATDLNCDMSRIGLSGSPTNVVSVFSPPQLKSVQFIEGSSEEQVTELLGVLASIQGGTVC